MRRVLLGIVILMLSFTSAFAEDCADCRRMVDENDQVIYEQMPVVDGVPRTFDYAYAYTLIDENGFPGEAQTLLIPNGETYTIRRYRNDSEGRPVFIRYYDAQDEPVLTRDGYAGKSLRYDENGLVAEEAYFGIEDEPVMAYFGCHRRTFVYGSSGKLLREVRYGLADEEVPFVLYPWDILDDSSRNYSEIKVSRNNLGEISGMRYLMDSRAVPQNDNAAAGWHLDEDGSPMQFDQNDHALPEFVYERTMYRDNPYLTESLRTMVVDDSGNYLLFPGKSYTQIYEKFDVNGSLTARTYYDRKGNATECSDGYAGLTRSYDAKGQITGEFYYDPSGEPVLPDAGYAGFGIERSIDGSTETVTYYGLDREPIRPKGDGCAMIHRSFDGHGNIVTEKCLDERSALTADGNGISQWSHVYDEADRPVLDFSQDIEGRLAVNGDGYALRTMEYDGSGLLVRVRYYDQSARQHAPAGKSYAGWDADYANDTVPVIRFVGSDETVSYVKAAIEHYDPEKRVFSRENLGVDDSPVTDERGIRCEEAEFDENGRQISALLTDENGDPVKGFGVGYASWKADYDEFGQVTDLRFFGAGNEPVPYPGTSCHRWLFTYAREGILGKVNSYDIYGAGVETDYGQFSSAAEVTDFLHSLTGWHGDRFPVTEEIEPTPTAVPIMQSQSVGRYGGTTPEDGTEFRPGESFLLTWRIENEGTDSWDPGYRLVYTSGKNFSTGEITEKKTGMEIGAQTHLDAEIPCTAPMEAGTYTMYWKLTDSDGLTVISGLYLTIEVTEPIPTEMPD